MPLRALSIALVLLAGAASPAAAEDWKTDVDEGPVRIAMPAYPDRTHLAVGLTPMELLVWKDKVHPNNVLMMSVTYGYFAGRDRDKTIDTYKAPGEPEKALSDRKLKVDGRAVREIVWHTGGQEVTHRILAIDDNMIVMTTAFDLDAIDQAMRDRFFGSLVLHAGDAGWTIVNDPACHAHFEMPEAPVASSSKAPSGSTRQMWTLERAQGDKFFVVCSPGGAKGGHSEEMLDAAADAATKGQKASDRHVIKLGAYTGRAYITFPQPGVKAISRIYIANDTFFAIAFITDARNIDYAAFDRFFQTFRIAK